VAGRLPVVVINKVYPCRKTCNCLEEMVKCCMWACHEPQRYSKYSGY